MHNDTRFITFDFARLKETSWPIIALVVIVDAAVLAFAMLIVLPLLRSSFPLERLTGGLIQPTFIFSALRFLLVAVGAAMLVGGLTGRDVGLRWEQLPGGALVVFGLWVVMQLLGMLPGLISTGQVALSPIWTPERVPLIVGEVIAQFLGNAFAEEVIFRGFLLTQVYLMLRDKIAGRGWRVTAAVLLSQLIFSLSHIPQRMISGHTPTGLLIELAKLWGFGLLFAVLYLRTENVFIAVGVHALANAPVTVVAMPSMAVAVFLPLVLSLVLIAAWGALTRWQERLGAPQYA